MSIIKNSPNPAARGGGTFRCSWPSAGEMLIGLLNCRLSRTGLWSEFSQTPISVLAARIATIGESVPAPPADRPGSR